MILFVAECWGALLIIQCLHAAASSLAFVLQRVPIEEIGIGTGRPRLRVGILVIGAWPLGSYVRPKDTRNTVTRRAGAPASIRDAFDQQPRLLQTLTYLVGPAAMLIPALLVHPAALTSEFLGAFRQVGMGALGPLSIAQTYLHALQRLSGDFPVLLAVMATKLAAVNLLPLPVFCGGQAILALLRPGEILHARLQQIGLCVVLALLSSWLVACGAFLLNAGASAG